MIPEKGPILATAAMAPNSNSIQPSKPNFAQTYKKREEGIPVERPNQHHRRLVSSREGTGSSRPRMKLNKDKD